MPRLDSAAMRIRRGVLPLLACALLLPAACGSDEPKVFDEEGFAITFEYPGDFERTTDIDAERRQGQAEKSVALAMSEDNAIFVQRYGLNREVTADDAEAVKQELDGVLGELAGTEVSGKRIQVGGAVAFRYEVEELQEPDDGRSTIVAVFDGDTEYFINCQSVPDGREELDEACDRAIETLELRT
ncbi:MAG TPA: hypothetical protein VE270_04935 [Thermoleophilaceae bacterium]|nr:hypothetical protein [Thermoleophilaceae bacterium]